MNPYLKNLTKIEFVVTHACTGHCKHCSEGEHALKGEQINAAAAAEAVRRIASEYDIQTVMTFGGEPLLCVDCVEKIISLARDLNIPLRQVITNGYFSSCREKICEVARRLFECGVNDLLLSVDAFHQETIPPDVVRMFAAEARHCGVPIRLQPAWLVSRTHDNPYNRKTREILDHFSDLEIPENEGNVIFPEGNACKYLASYFTDKVIQNPYAENPYDVRCISFSPNGDVLGENIYKKDILEIIRDYVPQ